MAAVNTTQPSDGRWTVVGMEGGSNQSYESGERREEGRGGEREPMSSWPLFLLMGLKFQEGNHGRGEALECERLRAKSRRRG